MWANDRAPAAVGDPRAHGVELMLFKTEPKPIKKRNPIGQIYRSGFFWDFWGAGTGDPSRPVPSAT